MKRNNYQFTDLPVIDAGEGDGSPRGPRPLLWVLMALLIASAGVSFWVTGREDDSAPVEPSTAYPPSVKEKERLLGALAESTSAATEDERLAALESLSGDAAVSIEEMQAALSGLSEGEGL